MPKIVKDKIQTKSQATNPTILPLNPGPCSMDYGQWAEHPLTIDQC